MSVWSVPRRLAGAVLLLASTAGPSFAAVAFVQNLGVNHSRDSDGAIAITLGGTVPAGDTIIVSFAMDPKEGPVTCLDTRSHPWSIDADVISGSGVNGVRAVTGSTRVERAIVAGDIQVSHPNTDQRAMYVNQFSGLRSFALDRVASAIGEDANPASAATDATRFPDELILGTIGIEGPLSLDTFPPGVTFTALPRTGTQGGGAETNVTVAPEYRIVAAIGSYAASATLNNSREWVALVTTYRSACGDGVIDADEDCDDGNLVAGDCCAPGCTFEAAEVVCRPAAGMCDLAETCTGSSGTRPT